MRSKRIHYLMAFVAAMFLANNVAVAARAFVTGLSGQDIVAVQAFDATGAGQMKAADDGRDPCFTHCAQSYKTPEQELATGFFKVAFVAASRVPGFTVVIKPAASAVALAPQAAGPPPNILFGNLRN